MAATAQWTPGPLMRFQVVDDRLFTPGGFPVVCDGCGAHVAAPLDEATQVHPVLRPELYPDEGICHVVCPPGGRYDCLTLARAEDDMEHRPGPACACGACRMAYGGLRPLVPARPVPEDPADPGAGPTGGDGGEAGRAG